jgi:hypothetical protein
MPAVFIKTEKVQTCERCERRMPCNNGIRSCKLKAKKHERSPANHQKLKRGK